MPTYKAVRRCEVEVVLVIEAGDPQDAVEKAGGYLDTSYHPNFPDAVRNTIVTVPFDEVTIYDSNSDEELATS